jgi:hypothetical protein
LILPSTTSTIFNIFICTKIDDTSDSYLFVDVSIKCNSSQWINGVIYSSFMILVYPVGIPMIYFWLLYQVKNDIIALNDPTNHHDHPTNHHNHHHVDQLKPHITEESNTNNNTIVSFSMNSNHSDLNADKSNITHCTHNNNNINNVDNNNDDNNNDDNNNDDDNKDDDKNDYNSNECSIIDEVIIMKNNERNVNDSNVLQHSKSISSWIFGTSTSQKDPLPSTSSSSSSSSSSLSHQQSQSISQKQSSEPINHINEIGGNDTDENLSDPMSAASFYHFSKKHSNKSSYNDDNNSNHHKMNDNNDFDYSSNIDPCVSNSAKTLNSIKINNIYSISNHNNDHNNIQNDDINDNNNNNNNNNINNNNAVLTTKTKSSPKTIQRLKRKKTYLLIFEVKSIRFLWEPYRGNFWYWEVVECYRRIILTAGTLYLCVISYIYIYIYIYIYFCVISYII